MKYLYTLILVLFSQVILAQGDDCTTAYALTNTSNYCSSGAPFTNATSTVGSGFTGPTCWSSAGTQGGDVWFSFVATGTNVLISVNGSGVGTTTATMKRPNLVIFDGTCSATPSFTYNACTAGPTSNSSSIFQAGLTLGKTYYLCVSTTIANKGTFDLCINCSTPAFNPAADCSGAALLCDKSPVSVGSLSGAGSNTTEQSVGCMASSPELYSSWFKWTCKTTGTLDMTIVGTDPTEDIDWIIFEIPNLNTCTFTNVSCNIASCADATTGSRATGLKSTATGNSQSSGCSGSTASSWNQSLNITAGKSYALFVNNASGTSAFTITWGGTSEFLGPQAKITAGNLNICPGQQVTLSGSTSTASSGSVSLTAAWTFSNSPSSSTSTTLGSNTITYPNAGTYPAILTVSEPSGCKSTANVNVVVGAPSPSFTNTTVCSGTATSFTNLTSGTNTYTWDFGDGTATSSTASPTHTYSNGGNYTVSLTATNAGGCSNTTTQTVTVSGPQVTVSPTTTTVCPGTAVTLTGSSTLTPSGAYTKSFSNTTSTTIPDGGVGSGWNGTTGTFLTSNVTVSGINPSSYSINSICLDILHGSDDEVSVYIKNPCGNKMKLISTSSASYSNSNFTNTCFTPSATTAISSGTGSYSGNFKPDAGTAAWTTFVSGCANANGTWSLLVGDWYAGSTAPGSLKDWTISLSSTNSTVSSVWSPSTNLSSTSSATTTATPTSSTTYTYTVTDAIGCSSSKTAVITVASPTLTATPSACSSGTYSLSGTLTYANMPATGTLTITCSAGGTPQTLNAPFTSPINYSFSGLTANGASATVTASFSANSACNATATYTAPAACSVTCPTVSINYSTPYCYSLATAQAVTITGTGTYTGGTYSSTAGLTINSGTGAITPSTSTPGTYTVTYTLPASGGCPIITATKAITIDNVLAPTITTPINYCQNATASSLTATATGGGTLNWYGTASTGGTASSTAPIPTTSASGSTTYYVSQTVTGCESPRAAIVVNVTALPAAPTVTTPITYCQNATASPLTATATGGGTLNWYGTASTGGTASSTAPTPTTTASGSTTYYVSQTVSTCEGPRASIVVTINATPAAPTVSPVTYCINSSTSPLTATATGGGTLNWYGTASTGGTASSTAPTPTSTTSGNTTYYVSQTVSGCESTRASLVVTIASSMPAPTVTSPINYCQNATAIPLTATATSGGTLNWYGTASTGGTASATAPTPLTTTVGSTSYYVSQTVSGCEGPRATIVVDIKAIPGLPTVVSPVSYCQYATASALSATASGGGTLNWYGTAATGGTSSSIATVPSTTTATTSTYYVSQSVNGCEGARASIAVTINAAPGLPTVVSPVAYCQNATPISLSATATGGATLNWYGTASTGGTASSTAPTPTTSTAGSTTYYVSQTEFGCEGQRASIVVNITATPAAPTITTPVTYCQNAPAIALTATATGGATLNWYGTSATGGTSSSTAPTPSTSSASTTAYYVSQSVGSCEGPRAQINVVVYPTPSAPTVTTPVTYCQNATASALVANATGSGSLMWYGTSATGGTASSTAPTPSTSTVGTPSYYVSQTENGCEGPRATINVTINATPAAPTVTTPVTYCQNTTAIALTATATGGASLNWYGTAVTGGTSSATAPTPSTTVAGNTNYYVSQTNLGCEGPRASITVTVNSTPVSPTITTPVNYCQNATAIALTATATGGATLKWYGTSATGGTASSTAPTPVTSSVGSATYYVSQSNLGCEGPRAAITVSISATPAAPQTVDVQYCQKATSVALLATATSGATLRWYGTSATGGTASTNAPIPSTNVADTFYYYVSQISNGCESVRTPLTVIIHPTPKSYFYSPVEIIDSEPFATFTNKSLNYSSFVWDFGDGSPLDSSSNSPDHSYSLKETDKGFTVTLTVKSGSGCVSSSSKYIAIKETILYYIPNSFTPDNDQYNNDFKPVLSKGFDVFNGYHLQIFNRWGELIFESKDYSVGWDGTYGGINAQDGVYIWVLEAKLVDVDDKRKWTGHVSLLK